MNRNILLFIILALTVGLVLWVSRGNKFFNNLIAPTAADTAPPRIEVHRELPDPSPTAIGRSVTSTSPPPADRHQEQVEQENQKLAVLRDNLDTLKGQLAQQEQATNLSFPAKISEDTTQIENLTSVLQEDRLAERDVNDAAMKAMNEQSTVERAKRDQLDQNIRYMEQDIQRNQEMINYYGSIPPNMPEQRDDLDNARNQLNAQLQQLADLRLQRLNISAQVLDQSGAINNSADQQKADIVSNEGALQNQIASLRVEITQLQNQRQQVRMSTTSLSQQIRQAEEAYNQELQKAKTMASSQTTQ
jgi:chromosome segregation ATPase